MADEAKVKQITYNLLGNEIKFTPKTSISKQYEGIGLGRALVKELVELHDGRTWVESEVGKGGTSPSSYLQVTTCNMSTFLPSMTF